MRAFARGLAAVMAAPLALPAAPVDVTPARAVAVLEKRCGQCHGDQTAASGLRLSGREPLLRGGKRGPAVKPGSPADSLLFQAVSHTGKISMPPAGQLDSDEIEILRVWIEKGAEWPSGAMHAHAQATNWWAFRSPVLPPVPEIAGAATPMERIERGIRASIEWSLEQRVFFRLFQFFHLEQGWLADWFNFWTLRVHDSESLASNHPAK